jgi:hypothetical protein
MSIRGFIKRNVLSVTIVLFIIVFGAVNYIKPGLMYNEHGELRPFGIGYSHKTIMPVWLFAIILAILSYLYVQILAKNII